MATVGRWVLRRNARRLVAASRVVRAFLTQAAGLSAGDVVIAVDGIKVTNGTLDTLLARRARGSTVRVHAFRRDELIEREVRLGKVVLRWTDL